MDDRQEQIKSLRKNMREAREASAAYRRNVKTANRENEHCVTVSRETLTRSYATLRRIRDLTP